MLSEHVFFVIERITDIFELEKEKKLKFSNNNVKSGIEKLQKELSRIYDYLKCVETNYDDRQGLLENEQPFYLNFSYIAHSSDDILDGLTTNNYIFSDIDTLLQTIRNSYNNPSFTQFKLKVVVKDNINTGGDQNLANMKLSLDHSKPSKNKQDSRPKSFGHYPNHHLVGFNHEIQTLLNHLLQTYDVTRFVGIVGMGGSGKTTLAKHIYHHPKINIHFTSKVWICISQSWDKTSILNSIWKQATKDPKATEMGYDDVVRELHTFLSSHSHLIVLDDIWSINAWNHIYQAFPKKRRSAILITTRNKILPLNIDPSVLIVEQKQLNDEESYELFKKRASLLDDNTPHELRSLGEKMVKKCKGLPLAIVALAGVLRMDKRQSSWEAISEIIMDMENESTQGVVKEILALSYYELPKHLKSCVLYLQVFPEDYVIEAEQLTNMWIAEYFMNDESVAERYVDEIAQRCIVEVVKTNLKGQVSRFRIHDLMRQMFVDMDKKRGLLNTLRLAPSRTLYDDELESNTSRTSETIFNEDLQRIVASQTNSHLRSIILLQNVVISRHILLSIFAKFRLLRVLILQRTFGIMPEAIGDLIHLRYLELRGDIGRLPMSFGKLVNLWTLDMRNSYLANRNWTALNTLYKLKELRHLYLPYLGRVSWGHVALEKPKLKTLRNATGGSWMLSGMPELSVVLQELNIKCIESKEELEAVFTTPSITSNNLETLELEWYLNGTAKLYDMSILGKCQSLRKLSLNGEIGVGTPILFPPRLNQLVMWSTCLEERGVMDIISKSCPHLKFLSLRYNSYKGSELVCNANSFPQLENLELWSLDYVKKLIIEESAMPRLRQLEISSCNNLDLNSEGWTRMSKIPYVNVEDMPPEFMERFRIYRKVDTTYVDVEDMPPEFYISSVLFYFWMVIFRLPQIILLFY